MNSTPLMLIRFFSIVAALLLSGQALASDGRAIYQSSCVACHGSGAAGSPKTGDTQAWAPRIAKGIDLLMDSAIKGVPGTAMLPRGTCTTCSDEDLRAAIEYMISNSQ